MIVEWSYHMWHTDTDRYPVNPDTTYDPRPLSEHKFGSADPVGDYLDRMDEVGIDRAVLVQPEPYIGDHSLVLDCVYEDPDRLRATSLFHPRDPDAPDKLEDLVADHGDVIVSTRLHTAEYYMDGFGDEGVRQLWETASDLGLIVELHTYPGYARGAAELIEAYPETPVLVDHLAEPQKGDPVEYGDVLALSEYDNVYMKLSDLGHFADDPPLYTSVTPFTRCVVDAFGPENTVWSGGTPDIVDTHLAHYSEADRAKVKGDTLFDLVWDE